ncbi:MAG: thiosulfate oxidation carrier protein SoxY [Candidatus Competibacterales bacterium]|nr:thiosulfate oxidation carrier protein SoxY [Candidatus Competibacterales bacterium]
MKTCLSNNGRQISDRRRVLRLLGSGTLVLTCTGLAPLPAMAAWPADAFAASGLDAALRALFDGRSAPESPAITLEAPTIAENGAVVPISISTTLPGVQSLHVLVEHNPVPWVASFELAPRALPELSTRIKMSETSQVLALADTDEGLFMTAREIRVSVGGCGV